MDPLSVGASAITIADSVGGALRALGMIHEAPSEIHALINDISDLQIVIREVHLALSQRIQIGDLPQNVLEGLNGLLQRANHGLFNLNQILRVKLIPGDSLESRIPKFARIRWISVRNRVRKIQKELSDVKINITTMWGAATSFDLSRLHLKLEEFAFVTGILTAETRRLSQEQQQLLLQAQPIAGTMIESGILGEPECVLIEGMSVAESEFVDVPGITTGISGISIDYQKKQLPHLSSRKRIQDLADDVDVHDKQMTWPASPAWSPDKSSGGIAGVRVGVTQVLEERCHRWCSCICHKRTHHRTPAKLNRLVGSFFFGYSSLPYLSPPCNEKRCRRRSSPSVRINYYFPAWFAMRAIVFMATQHKSEPEFLLRVTRMVPPNAEIFFFAETGNVDGLKDLFNKGLASPYDVEAGTGISALHKAVDWRQMNTTQLLLSAGANPFLEDQNGWTAVETVCQHAFTTSSHQQPFNHLLRTLDMDIFENLQFSTLHKIILKLVNLDLEQHLMASTADIDVPNSSGQTPLFWAANQGDATAVRLLLENGANPNLISMLGEVPLHWSIEAERDTCTRLLLKHGALPNVRSHFGTTPLHYAIWTHEDPANHVEPLVKHGANVNLQNLKGRGPLHYALNKDWVRPAAFLLEKGADLEMADNDGVTPLIEALKNDLPKVTRLLLQRGANPLVRDKNDDTILHIAAAKSTMETFLVLELQDLKSIETDAVNTAGETPRDLVLQRHDKSEALAKAFDHLINCILEIQAAELTGSEVDEVEREAFEDAFEYLDNG